MRTAPPPGGAAAEPLHVALSWPEHGEASLSAAATVLESPDTDTVLDRLYPKLLDHKMFLIAAAHLERAGGDLNRLTISAELVETLWPFNALFPTPDGASSGRVSIAAIARRLEAHRGHLDGLLHRVLEARPKGFLLLFGASIRAAYASYEHGFSHDLDVLTPDLAAGMSLLEVFSDELGFGLLRLRSSRADRQRVAHLKLFRLTDDGHRLYVDLIASGRPAGPRTAPPWIHPPLWKRARPVPFGDKAVLVPSPEDMLLLAAEKTRRKADFSRRQCNDVRFLLRQGEGSIDWDYLSRAVRYHAVGSALHRLIEDAERREGRPLVPSELRRRLAPRGKERAIVTALGRTDLAMVAGRGASGPGARGGHRRLLRSWTRRWAATYALRRWRSPGLLVELVVDRARSVFLKVEFKVARMGPDRELRRLGARARPIPLAALPKRPGQVP
jgi:Uncharacterised nucleotidyltransferase